MGVTLKFSSDGSLDRCSPSLRASKVMAARAPTRQSPVLVVEDEELLRLYVDGFLEEATTPMPNESANTFSQKSNTRR